MIISKPKVNTLFALAVFLLICYALIIYTSYNLLHYAESYWYQYVILALIIPIAITVTIKASKSFKVISLGKGKLMIKYPLLRRSNTHNLKDLHHWKEEVIKTGGSVFKELSIHIASHHIKLTSQENGEYDKIYGYLKKKHASKNVK